MEPFYVIHFFSTWIIDTHKKIIDVVVFDGASNVHLGGELLKIYNPKLTVMCGVEHSLSLFFSDVSKIPIVNQLVTAHKAIYKIFGSGIYHKLHYIFKNKYYEYHNRNIGLLSSNDTRMHGYFIGITIYMHTREALIATFSSA